MHVIQTTELRTLFADAIRSIQGNGCPYHCKPVLTSQMGSLLGAGTHVMVRVVIRKFKLQ